MPLAPTHTIILSAPYHQGNVRQVTDADGNVEQDNHYYPYGMLMAESSDILAGAGSSTANPYLFGAKEYLTTAGSNLLDFTARTYDPSTFLFHTQDPKSDVFTHYNSYTYCGGDPVNRVDRDGECLDTIWDFGCIGYDGYSTVRNVAKGDYSAAKESAKDLFFDIAAALIPGVPAGIHKAIKGVDKAVDATKAVDKATDAAKAFEKEKLQESIAQGKDVVDQVTLVPQNGVGNVKGNRTVTDQLIRNNDGTYTIIETKLTNKTRLSDGQQTAYDHWKQSNGLFEVRSNKLQFGLKKGQIIKVSEYKRIDKYTIE